MLIHRILELCIYFQEYVYALTFTAVFACVPLCTLARVRVPDIPAVRPIVAGIRVTVRSLLRTPSHRSIISNKTDDKKQ